MRQEAEADGLQVYWGLDLLLELVRQDTRSRKRRSTQPQRSSPTRFKVEPIMAQFRAALAARSAASLGFPPSPPGGACPAPAPDHPSCQSERPALRKRAGGDGKREGPDTESTASGPKRHSGAETQNRTGDNTIFSRVLYQLSYLGKRDGGHPLGRPPSTGGPDGIRTRDLMRDRHAR